MVKNLIEVLLNSLAISKQLYIVCHDVCLVCSVCSLSARRSSTLKKDLLKKDSAVSERLIRQETMDQEVSLLQYT